jgi:hypothetical protein
MCIWGPMSARRQHMRIAIAAFKSVGIGLLVM